MIQKDLHPETVRIVPAAGFNVRDFARTARGSHRAELFLEAYAEAPLDNDTLQVVDLLARLERGALRYLRTVLVTPAHSDARVTGFLVTWAYEKYWWPTPSNSSLPPTPAMCRRPHQGCGDSRGPGTRSTSGCNPCGERWSPTSSVRT